jgi:hypothetical protein
MAQYELSIDPSHVAEAERLVALDGRKFPTLVCSWESSMLGQDWQTVLVQDYTIPLPPLEQGRTFNEVRIAAYTGDVPTKFLYFGTELDANAPRLPPEMENSVSPSQNYQEYRLTAESCAVTYLDLIQTTPRVYGNGPQDYYSPPIKVERFDAGTGIDLISDNFPKIVADLDPIDASMLTDPRNGFWQGSRFSGTKKMAILKQGKVCGLRRRAGRSDKEVVPPEIVRRDPHVDVRDAWVAIDLGAHTTVIAIGNGDRQELVRLGAQESAKVSRDYEVPSEIGFNDLASTVKAWRDRVILPLTEWGDVVVGHAAEDRLRVHGKERAQRYKSSVGGLSTLAARFEAGETIQICGRDDLDRLTTLTKPAPPIIDEEGIGPDDPFDPLELFAYYIGLNVNDRRRGIHLRYAIGMPTGWSSERRTGVLAQMRRGILRSLPAGMVAYDDLDLLQVIDAGPNVLSFAAYAFKVFGISPKGEEAVPFVSIDVGASETSILCGHYRNGTPDELAGGFDKIVVHAEPTVLWTFGGEWLLHRMAYRVYEASATSMKNHDIPFLIPQGEDTLAGAEDRLVPSIDAATNVRLLKDALRPILEKSGPSAVPDMLQLFGRDGRVRDVRVMVDRAALTEWMRARLSEAAVTIKAAVDKGLDEISRGDIPWEDVRVLLGGRLGMNAFLQERLEAELPPGAKLHRFLEPDDTNLARPTVKLATALGILALRFTPVAPSQVSDERAGFTFRVGRAKRGKLHTVLDQTVGMDEWRELGACTRPEVTVLYTGAGPLDVSSDDPSITRVSCNLGYDAVGYRVYMRAVGSNHVEVSVGPPGGRPDEDAQKWSIDLAAATAEPMSQR